MPDVIQSDSYLVDDDSKTFKIITRDIFCLFVFCCFQLLFESGTEDFFNPVPEHFH